MTLGMQILWGSFWLGLSCAIHVLCLSVAITWLSKAAPRVLHWPLLWRTLSLMSLALLVIVFSHTAQVWKWAMMFKSSGELGDWNEALYFSLVTYTSLGYGDVVLSDDWRIFGAFASVTGLLSFGLSTALIVALLSRVGRTIAQPEDGSR